VPLKTNLSAAEMAALEDVLRSRAPASSMRLEYYAGTRDLNPQEDRKGVIEAEWGRPDAERPALEFTGTFRETLPLSLRKEKLTVDLVVETALGEHSFRRFTGDIRRVTPTPAGTIIQAASGGYWLDKVRFGEVQSYVNVAPSAVVWDAVTRAAEAGVYDLRHAEIEYVAGPKVRREEFLLNLPMDKLARPVSAAVEEGELFFRDSPLNAPLSHRDRGPAEAESVEWEYIVGRDTEPVDFRPETEGDEFYDVVCYRTLASGNQELLFDPIKIAGSTAPIGAGYEINVSDESDTATDDTYQMAAEAALRLRDGESTSTQSIKWIHPLLVDGDFVGWTEPFDEATRAGTRIWIAKIDTLKESSDLTQEMSMTLVRRREEEESVAKVSPLGVVRSRGA
jgi:hypothetical protein